MAVAMFTLRLTIDDDRIGEADRTGTVRLNEEFVEQLESEIKDRLDKVDTDLWSESDVIFEDAE